MKVLLTIAPYYYPHKHATRAEFLGPLYLASSLQEAGHTLRFFDPTMAPPVRTGDLYAYGFSEKGIRTEIETFSPDVVGISCNNRYSLDGTRMVASLAKTISHGSIITVAGGIYPSVYGSHIFEKCDELDFALKGEAERSCRELLTLLSSKHADFSGIDGLMYRDGDKVLVNEKKSFIHDLDSLAYPARDLVDIDKCMKSCSPMFGLGGKPTLSLLTSRSCPNRCSFCNMWMMHGSRWRARSPENVIGELEEMVGRYGAKHVMIMDDNFTFKPERAKAILEEVIRRGLKFRWNTPNGISVRGMDQELADLMKRSGCANVSVGIESGSPYIRNRIIRKGISDRQIVNAVNCLHKAKIPVGGYFIVGMPEETGEHFSQTVDFAKRLKLSFIAVSFAGAFPGTWLHSYLVKEGIISQSFDFNYDHFKRPSFATKDFTKKDLFRRRSRLYRSFFLSHAYQIFKEFLSGRLNWMSPGLFVRVLADFAIK